jgi:hypothetical protein
VLLPCKKTVSRKMNDRANIPTGHLFIGGPIDGTVKQVVGSPPVYHVSWVEPPTFSPEFTFDMNSSVGIHCFTYNLTRLGSEFVYLGEDLTIHDAISKLVKHYSPNPIDTSRLVSREMREHHRQWLEETFGI